MKQLLKIILIISYSTYVSGTDCQAIVEYFSRISLNSKYLWANHWQWDVTYDEAVTLCRERGLEIGSITSLTDYKAINTFLKETKEYTLDRTHWIDGSDGQDEGVWKYGEGGSRKNFTFSQFYGWNPLDNSYGKDKLPDFARLVYTTVDPLSESHNNFGFAMIDSEPSATYPGGRFICQYKKTSPCFKNSVEEKANKKLKDNHEKLGETKSKKYYIGNWQKSWYKAKAYCRSKSMKLLNLKLSIKEAKGLYKILKKWLLKKGLMAITNSFFLSGKNCNLFKGNNPIPWEWIDSRFLDQNQDPIISQKLGGKRKFGRCLSIGTLLGNGTTFGLARTLCTIPRWVVCFSNKGDDKPGPNDAGSKKDEDKKDEDKKDEDKKDEDKKDEDKRDEEKTDEDKKDEDKKDEDKKDEDKKNEDKTDENKSDEDKKDENKTDEESTKGGWEESSTETTENPDAAKTEF